MYGIVIATCPKNSIFLENLLPTIKTEYPIYIVITNNKSADIDYKEWIGELSKTYRVLTDDNDSFELGAIKIAMNLELDDFFFLQDSCEIVDNNLFAEAFSYDGAFGISTNYLSYLGKYKSSILSNMNIEIPTTKLRSIELEGNFNKEYLSNFNKQKIVYPDFGLPNDKSYFKYKFGRKNLVCVSEYLIKYKGVWDSDRYFSLNT